MKKTHDAKNIGAVKPKQNSRSSHPARPHFSQAAMEVAKNNLKEFEAQSDEAFLIRAATDRKLSAL